MSDSVTAFEKEENQRRAGLPAVFSCGRLQAGASQDIMKVECTTYFEDLLDTLKQWAAKTEAKIVAHNEELEIIKKELLMSFQELLDRAIVDKYEARVAALEAQLVEERK